MADETVQKPGVKDAPVAAPAPISAPSKASDEPSFKASSPDGPIAVDVVALRDESGKPRLPLDEHGRLALDSSPVDVPSQVAAALEVLPHVKVEVVR